MEKLFEDTNPNTDESCEDIEGLTYLNGDSAAVYTGDEVFLWQIIKVEVVND